MLAQISNAQSLFLNDVSWTIFGVVCIVVLLEVHIFLHEFGHWLMAKLCGYRPVAFSVGEGKLLWQRETGSSLWKIHLCPISGYIMALKLKGPETRLQSFLLSFGGPLFTALCAFATWRGYLYFSNDVGADKPLNIVLAQILAITCVLTVISFVYNVWPMLGSGDIGANDGLTMLMALTSKSFPRASSYEHAIKSIPSDPAVKDGSAMPQVSEEAKTLHLDFVRASLAARTSDLLKIIRQALALPQLTPAETYAWQAFLLTAALHHSNDRHLLESAMEVGEPASEKSPTDTYLTRLVGGLHIELGDHLKGRGMLYRIERDAPEAADKAFALAYLAISDLRQGWKSEASDRLHRARLLCPSSFAVRKAAREIQGGFDSIRY